jgi:hypothetical protein
LLRRIVFGRDDERVAFYADACCVVDTEADYGSIIDADSGFVIDSDTGSVVDSEADGDSDIGSDVDTVSDGDADASAVWDGIEIRCLRVSESSGARGTLEHR